MGSHMCMLPQPVIELPARELCLRGIADPIRRFPAERATMVSLPAIGTTGISFDQSGPGRRATTATPNLAVGIPLRALKALNASLPFPRPVRSGLRSA